MVFINSWLYIVVNVRNWQLYIKKKKNIKIKDLISIVLSRNQESLVMIVLTMYVVSG